MEKLKSWGSHGPPWHPPNSAYLHEYMNIVYIYSLLYAGTIFLLLYIVIYLYFTFFYLDDLYLNKIEMILHLFFFKMLWLRANFFPLHRLANHTLTLDHFYPISGIDWGIRCWLRRKPKERDDQKKKKKNYWRLLLSLKCMNTAVNKPNWA